MNGVDACAALSQSVNSSLHRGEGSWSNNKRFVKFAVASVREAHRAGVNKGFVIQWKGDYPQERS